MKNLSLALVLLIIPALGAQEADSFIQSAPIAVSAEGEHGEMGEDEATMKARAELSASKLKPITADTETELSPEPVVEQVAVEQTAEKEAAKEEATKEEATKEPPAPPKWRPSFPKLTTEDQPRSLQIGYSHLDSSWSKVGPSLKDGSTMISLSLVQHLGERASLSVGLDFLHPKEEKMTPEEVRVFQFHLRPEIVFFKRSKMQLFTSLGFGVSDYNLRKKISSTGTQDTYETFGSGTAVYLAPGAGLRMNLSTDTGVDLNIFYAQYFGSKAQDFGGLGAGLRLQFKL